MNIGNERLLDLLTQQATDDLSETEQRELASLLEREGADAHDEIQLATAAAFQAFAEYEAAPAKAPASLIARLEADAERFFSDGEGKASVTSIDTARESATPAPMEASHWIARSGWAVAAGLAMILLLGERPAPVPDPSEGRAALVADALDAGVYTWNTPTIDDYRRVQGDVAWSSDRQQGYLRLVGMPINDPAISQYQLWIVDPARDAEPVDGGVFDIPSDGEVVVPIDAKLPITAPTAFAITREQPGGVVVSEGPLLVVATSD